MADPLQVIAELEQKCPDRPWRMWDGWGPDTQGEMHATRTGPDGGGGIEPSDPAHSDLRATREDFEGAVTAINALPAALAALRRAIEHECVGRYCAACQENARILEPLTNQAQR